MADTEEEFAHDNGADSRKGAWSADEDEQLRILVAQYGTTCWSQIAAGKFFELWVGWCSQVRLKPDLKLGFLLLAGVPGRSGKSCRLRWVRRFNSQHK